MNIAINGFGRIGRQVLRIILKDHPELNVVLINDLTDNETLAHLFEFDSTYGRFEGGDVSIKDGKLATQQGSISLTSLKDPLQLPHKKLNVDLVLECTGVFRTRDTAAMHLEAGAKKVIVSAPMKDAADGTFCIGVNHELYDNATMHVVSNASCTTNCLAPMVKVLHDAFGIESGLMTTIHSVTNDQRILDLPHRDLRRARSAMANMIPTSTGAAVAVGLVIPELNGKLNGSAIRVPTATGSITDLTCKLLKNVTVDEVIKAYESAENGPLKGVLGVEHRPLVQNDYVGDSRSCIIDAPMLKVIDGNLVKVMGWYDNEWGYSTRMVELASMMLQQL